MIRAGVGEIIDTKPPESVGAELVGATLFYADSNRRRCRLANRVPGHLAFDAIGKMGSRIRIQCKSGCAAPC